jgi:tyrosyl-tRNA synthetase
MSISDELMWRYFELLSFRPLTDLDALRQAVDDGRNPRDVKFELGLEITARFHGQAAAEAAKGAFVSRFQQGAMPDEMPEKQVDAPDGSIGIAHLLRQAGLVSSTSEGFRMIQQGAVRIDGERVEDRGRAVTSGTSAVFQVGKRRFARVTVN